MEKVVGLIHQHGDFEGKPYNNYIFCVDHIRKENVKRESIGNVCDLLIKVKADVISRDFNGKVSELIGKNVEFYKNDYKQVVGIRVE